MLKQIARLLSLTVRSTDLVARYGGEEFALILPNTDSEGAQHLAERCRAVIAQTVFRCRSITASIGVATNQGGPMTADELITRADATLYLAKHRGRNIVVYGAEPAAASSRV